MTNRQANQKSLTQFVAKPNQTENCVNLIKKAFYLVR